MFSLLLIERTVGGRVLLGRGGFLFGDCSWSMYLRGRRIFRVFLFSGLLLGEYVVFVALEDALEDA